MIKKSTYTLITALFLVVSPLGLARSPAAADFYSSQFYLWSYIHIISAVVLSSSHPRWLVRAAEGTGQLSG